MKEARNLLEKLVDYQSPVCVSMYLPTVHKGPEVRQNPIRLKNALAQAEQRLKQMGMDERQALSLLDPVRQLVDSRDWSEHQENGAGFFLSDNFIETIKLAEPPPAEVVVSNAFHLRPLLRAATDTRSFFLLALSGNDVRLFHCDGDGALDVSPGEMPKSIEEALRWDDPEKSIQQHASSSGRVGDMIRHGHGAAKEDEKKRLWRFFQKVDAGVGEVLNGKEEPLVLAAVDYYAPIYAEANHYPHLMDGAVFGSPEGAAPVDLRRAAEEKLRPMQEKNLNEALDAFGTARAQQRGTTQIEEAVRAAVNGRAQACFVARGARRWGTYEASSAEVREFDHFHPCSRDLLDLAATKAWMQSGQVWFLDRERMPEGADIAVTFRY